MALNETGKTFIVIGFQKQTAHEAAKRTVVEVRRVNHPDRGDEVQIQVNITHYLGKTERMVTIASSLSLNPGEVEELIAALSKKEG